MSLFFAQNAPSEDHGYGYLYNWYAIDGNTTNFINDLHVPTDAEITIMDTYLGGISVAGGKLKQTGTSEWFTPNTDATDEYNFTAIPSGYRSTDFFGLSILYYFWSATSYDTARSYRRYLSYNDATTNRFHAPKFYGMYIRCMRDLTSQEQIDFSDGEIIESKTDFNGNSYNVVRIGTQGWTITNLKAINYLTGTAITNVTDNTEWAGLTTGARCAYDNNETNV